MTSAVMIPGTLCDARVFGALAAAVALDCLLADPLVDARADEAARRILRDAPRSFVAIGFSLGGFVALEMLRLAPERLRGVVMISSNPLPAAADQAAARRADVALAQSEGMPRLIERLWPLYVAPTRQSDESVRAVISDMAEAVGLAKFAAQTELAISRSDARDLVRTSPVHTLWLYGEVDRLNAGGCGPYDLGTPKADAIVLKGSGHFIPLEASLAAAEAINAWTKEHGA